MRTVAVKIITVNYPLLCQIQNSSFSESIALNINLSIQLKSNLKTNATFKTKYLQEKQRIAKCTNLFVTKNINGKILN